MVEHYMHSKLKGNIGETAVAKVLMMNGYKVFSEMGDLSKIDLIAESPKGILTKVQVKYVTGKSGKVEITSRKSAKGYEFRYTESDFDVMAVYCPETDSVAFVGSDELCATSTICLRVFPPKNNQTKGIKWFKDYTLDRLNM